MSRYLGIDLETFSSADLKAVGAHRYAEDPSFEVLLFGFAFDDDDPTVIDLTAHEPIPKDVLDALRLNGIIKSGWNIAFERACLARHLGFDQPAGQWEDTMVLASVCGLPMGLGDCGAALHMSADKAKDKDGKALIRWFCKPCKPTKTRPDRTRHMPGDYPEKWSRFVAYNGQDVVAERAIRKTLAQWAPTGAERKIWAVDQQINDRGIRVDLTLANAAREMDRAYKAELTQQAIALTGMENPNSVEQVKQWLGEQEDIEVPSLNKKVVADVVAALSTDTAKQFMAIRSELARSSTKKFDAMVLSACADDHVRGCFQFCGAGRTGRWAGRRVQLQNLAKNKMPDLAACRSLVRTGDLEATRLLYGDISSTLSELVRTALIPEPGHTFIVCDYSAIEARVLAWIAGEEWALEEFRGKGQIYEATGAMMFHVPKETIAKGGCNHHRRQAAKTAVLACVAEGQLVLTDRGPVPIEQVTTNDMVWDGESWVRHEGLIRRGRKQVIRVNGVEITTDHKILTEKGMVACGKAGGLNWAHIRLPYSPWPWGAEAPGERAHRADLDVPVRMRKCENSSGGPPYQEEKADSFLWLYVPEAGCAWAHNTWNDEHKTVQRLESDAGTLLQPERQKLAEVRGPRNHGLRQMDVELPEFPGGYGADLQTRVTDRTQGRLTWVFPRELHLGDQIAAGQKQEEQHRSGLPMGAYDTSGSVRSDRYAVLDPANQVLSEAPVNLSGRVREAETFDLLNAGPRHRFCLIDMETGALRCVSNCGYGGGKNALLAFGADKMGMSDEDMIETVDLWRKANPRVVRLWKDLERAAIRCVVHGTTQVSRTGGIRFDFERGILWMTLPSGRRIAYFGAQYGESRWKNGRTLSYMGIEQKTHKWARLETWGGRLVENLTQATARDCLRDAMIHLTDAGFDIRAHIHDEVVITEPLGGRTVEDVAAIMGQDLPWAPGLPLRGDGYTCDFYMKDG